MSSEGLIQLRVDRSGHGPPSALERELARVVDGEVRFGGASRALYATDASNYRQVPIGVVIPRSLEAVERAVAVCRAHDAPVLCRGGGTSLAGQCCNEAVVLDFSKYLGEVLEIDTAKRRARVQPGTVLDTLNGRARQDGLLFGPDPSTHSHCALGGMIGNNSCGVHAVMAEFYGPGARTEDNLEELEVLTYRGQRLRVGPTSDEDYARILREGGANADIHRQLKELVSRHAAEIRSGFPQIPRRVSGYNLPALLPENGFNVARALSGTEGTVVTVLEATVTLIPALPHRVLLVIGYPSVYEAGDDIPRVREFSPVGCEGLDSELIEYMKKKHVHTRSIPLLPPGKGWLLVEFGADAPATALEQAQNAANALRSSVGTERLRIVESPEEQAVLWETRKSALGATAFVPGQPDTWPGWEDAAVPVDRVGRYLRAFRELLERFGYGASLYGHFAQGCVHTRVNFDLTSREGIQKYRSFTDEAAELVLAHDGSLSGEHGDGQARGDLLPKMYGPELMQAFREFKRIWDPDGMMNPGKVIDAMPRDENLRLGADYHPWRPPTRFAYAESDGDFSRAALRCVGVGKCRRHQGGTMCPSYMATREEMHSTRGRAHLLFEMLRGETVRSTWHNDEVKEALDLCLSCKGCKSDCPVNVDIALHKAEFLYHYYKGRLRPRQAFSLGLIRLWAGLASWLPRTVNWLLSFSWLARFAKWAAGIASFRELPRFASDQYVGKREAPDQRRRVVLWPDTFSRHFRPKALRAAEQVLTRAGCQVVSPKRSVCCGRPLYDFGMLDLARRQWHSVLQTLDEELERGSVVVGIEPSCVAAFRDELPELMSEHPSAKKLSERVYTLAEFLVDELDFHPPRLPRNALVQHHCHQRAVLSTEADWELMRRLGLTVEELSSGCCGMAGAFGFERDKADVSVAIAEQELLPRIRSHPDTLLIADGFSCRQQIHQLTGREPVHLAELLATALGGG